MVKAVQAAMLTHLDSEVTTLASCWHVQTVDGVDLYLTDHDQNILFGGNTYVTSSSYSRSAIENNSSMSVDNLELEGILADGISENDLRNGVYNHAKVWVFMVNWVDPDGVGPIKLRYGRLGEVRLTASGFFSVELRGLTQPLIQSIGEVYTPECRADLGDTRCKVPLYPVAAASDTAYTLGQFASSGEVSVNADNTVFEVTTAGTTASSPPTWDYTVGNTTTDGTVVWTAIEGYSRTATVATVVDRTNFTVTFDLADPRKDDSWYAGGVVKWLTGANAGAYIEVGTFTDATDSVNIYLPMKYTIQVGDTLYLEPSCDKRRVTCRDKYSNINNMRAEPFVPGQDEALAYPDRPG